jgi:membrane-associated protease RseP (regulator of RpoE activity)
VLDDPRFARARPYLTGAPVAVVVLGDVHVLAAAQPDPLDAWVAIDVAGSAEPVAQAITARIAELAHDPAAAAVAGALRLERPAPSQLVVQLSGAPTSAASAGLAAVVRAALVSADAERDRAPAAGRPFACPAPGPEVACSGGTRYRLASVAYGLAPIVAAGRPAPVVVNGGVAGLRLRAAVPGLGLDAGDVIVAVSGRLVTSPTMLAERIADVGSATTVTVRRGTEEAVLEFAER